MRVFLWEETGRILDCSSFLKMYIQSSISRTVTLALCLIIASLPWTTAVSQVRHDKDWQPDYILRITEDTVPIACETRFSALVNGTSVTSPRMSVQIYASKILLTDTVLLFKFRKYSRSSAPLEGKPNHMDQSVQWHGVIQPYHSTNEIPLQKVHS